MLGIGNWYLYLPRIWLLVIAYKFLDLSKLIVYYQTVFYIFYVVLTNLVLFVDIRFVICVTGWRGNNQRRHRRDWGSIGGPRNHPCSAYRNPLTSPTLVQEERLVRRPITVQWYRRTNNQGISPPCLTIFVFSVRWNNL